MWVWYNIDAHRCHTGCPACCSRRPSIIAWLQLLGVASEPDHSDAVAAARVVCGLKPEGSISARRSYLQGAGQAAGNLWRSHHC